MRRFRRLGQPLPPRTAPNLLRSWLESFSTISHLYWGADGTFYVQYFDTNGYRTEWRLVNITRTGVQRFEVFDSPELLAVSKDENMLIFLPPGRPNALLIGKSDQ
jgi:hypothetical protein